VNLNYSFFDGWIAAGFLKPGVELLDGILGDKLLDVEWVLGVTVVHADVCDVFKRC
jgi:hypothetical protein